MKERDILLLYIIVTFTLGFSTVFPIFSDKNHSIVRADEPQNDTFWNITTGEGVIYSAPTINAPVFWQFLLNNSEYTFWIKNGTGTWRDITSRFHLNYTNNGYRQKLEYDIDIPYAGTVYLNFTFGMNVTDWAYNQSHHNVTLSYEEDGYPYTLFYNFSDIASLPAFEFFVDVVDNHFCFSIKRAVPVAVHLKLDPSIFIMSSVVGFAFNNQRAMCRSSNGTIFVVYTAFWSSKYRIYIAHSYNYTGWIIDQIRIIDGAYRPVCAINSHDEIYITWVDKTTGTGTLKMMKYYYGNQSFNTNIINITTDIDDDVYSLPMIAVDSQDNAYTVYTDGDWTRLKQYVYANNSFMPAGEHTHFNMTSASFDSSDYATCVVDASDNVHILSQTEYGVNARIFYRKFWSGNLSFNSNIINVSVNGQQRIGTVCFDSYGNLHVVYDNGANTYYRKLWVSNNTWGANTIDLGAYQFPTVAQVENNSLIVFYKHIATNIMLANNYTFATNTWAGADAWVTGSLSTYSVSTLYAWYPIIDNVHTNIPTFGFCGAYYDGNIWFLNSSRLDWGDPRGDEDQGFWNISFSNPAFFRDFGFLNLSFRHTQFWEQQGFLNVSFLASAYFRDFGFFNISFSNETKFFITNPYPMNGSNGIPLQPTLRVIVTLSDASTRANLTWFWGNDSTCPHFLGVTFNTTNGTKYMPFNESVVQVKTYYWRVEGNVLVHDYWYWVNETYSFTTQASGGGNAVQIIQDNSIGVIGVVGCIGLLAFFVNRRRKRRNMI